MWLFAVATVAVEVACIYNPAMGAYVARFIGSIRSSDRVVAVLVPAFSHIVSAIA